MSAGTKGNFAFVDKYAPQKISDLVGQQGQKSVVNKLIMWLRAWKPHRGAEGKLSVLISGPPGVGKTTMVRLALRELNYESIELNASDARSARDLKEKYAESLLSDTINFSKNHVFFRFLEFFILSASYLLV